MRRERTGQSSKISGVVQSGANSVRTLPTLTPAAAKVPSNLPTPRFDMVNGVVVQLPAAALEHALEDLQYDISIAATPAGVSKTSSCVLIRLRQLRLIDGGVETTLCFSNSDKLPALARIERPNLLPGKYQSVPEEVHYQTFSAGAIRYPSLVEVREPSGVISTIRIIATDLNPDISQVSFGRGAQ